MNDARPTNSRKQLLILLVATSSLIIAALIIPESWLAGVRGAYDVDNSPDAFSDVTARVDRALRQGEPVPVSREELEALRPTLQTRRLLEAGPMTSGEVKRARKLLEDFQARVEAEASEGSRDAVRQHRNRRLKEEFPRLANVAPTLEKLRAEIEAAEFAPPESREPPETGGTQATCTTCHGATRLLPGGKTIDVEAIWPLLDSRLLADGRRLPTMMDSLEFEIWKDSQDDASQTCASCHAPHGDADFGVDDDLRRENMGVWVNTATVSGLLAVQVKVQNKKALHRVPGGPASHAYAVVVRAWASDDETSHLKPWQGLELPDSLRSESRQLGFLLSRVMADESGREVADATKATNILRDTRLEPGRFTDNRFLFRLDDSKSWRVRVDLAYLPDQTRWDDVRVIESVERSR